MSGRLRVLLADDEPLALRRLQRLLGEQPDVDIVAACNDGAEAARALTEHAPDVAFLDIEMPGLDAFATLDALGAPGGPAPLLVFVTAHHEHAVRAFEAGALDYVLKPFDAARLHKALGRARARQGQAGRDRYLRRLLVRTGGHLQVVHIADVDWVGAEGNYLCLHVGPVDHLLRGTMGDLEARLDPAQFQRVHRSALLNLDRIVGLRLSESGDYVATLKDRAEVRISRGYRERFLDRLGRLGVQDS